MPELRFPQEITLFTTMQSYLIDEDVIPREGEEVTIIPSRSPGMSRDTEPGLQPWTAKLVGVLTDGRILVDQGAYGLRVMQNGPLRRTKRGTLTFGQYD